MAVVDGKAGVYKVEEGTILYITHLKDITAELWSWEGHDTATPPYRWWCAVLAKLYAYLLVTAYFIIIIIIVMNKFCTQ